MTNRTAIPALSVLCGVAALPLFSAEESVPADEPAVPAAKENVPAKAGDAAGTPSAERAFDVREIYTPARSDVSIRQNLITPFYAFYSQALPASVSSGGKIASSVYGTGFSWRYIHPEKKRIALSNLDYRRTDYRFSGGNAPAPFRHTDSVRASTYQEFINPDVGFAVVATCAGSFSAEDRADLADGFGGFAGLGCKQYFSEKTSLTLGCTAIYRRDRERWFFFPFLVIDWSITENLNLRAVNGVTLTWDVFGNDAFHLGFAVEYSGTTFVVEKETDAASPHFGRDGAYYEQSVPVSVTGTWNVSESFFVSAGVTLDAWSKYRLYRGGHDTGETFSVDPAVEFSLQAGFRF